MAMYEDLLHGIAGQGARVGRLIRSLIASVIVIFPMVGVAGFQQDAVTSQGGWLDLNRFFFVDVEFVSDGLVDMRFKRSGLHELDEKKCSVRVYMRYMSDEKIGNFYTSFSHPNEEEGFSFGVFDSTLKFSGSIYLSFYVQRGGCLLDENYSLSKSYYFGSGIFSDCPIHTCPRP